MVRADLVASALLLGPLTLPDKHREMAAFLSGYNLKHARDHRSGSGASSSLLWSPDPVLPSPPFQVNPTSPPPVFSHCILISLHIWQE